MRVPTCIAVNLWMDFGYFDNSGALSFPLMFQCGPICFVLMFILLWPAWIHRRPVQDSVAVMEFLKKAILIFTYLCLRTLIGVKAQQGDITLHQVLA